MEGQEEEETGESKKNMENEMELEEQGEGGRRRI